MCEELINIVLFYEFAHRKVNKSSDFYSAPPLRKVANMSQANTADLCNFHKSSSKCFEIY